MSSGEGEGNGEGHRPAQSRPARRHRGRGQRRRRASRHSARRVHPVFRPRDGRSISSRRRHRTRRTQALPEQIQERNRGNAALPGAPISIF